MRLGQEHHSGNALPLAKGVGVRKQNGSPCELGSLSRNSLEKGSIGEKGRVCAFDVSYSM